MYVYIAPLKNEEVFKIGKSFDPYKRISNLSFFYPFNINKILLIKCNSEKEAYELENSLHKICKGHNIRLNNIDGREFFSNIIYEKVLNMVKVVCDMNNLESEYFDKKYSITTLNAHYEYSNISEIISLLGQRIKKLRIQYNMSQCDLSDASDTSLKAVKNLENGTGCTLRSLVKILIILGKIEWLNTFLSKTEELMVPTNNNGRERIRARKKTSKILKN